MLVLHLRGSEIRSTGETQQPWIRPPLCREQTYSHSYHFTHLEYHGLDHSTGIAYRATLDIYGRFWFTAFCVEQYKPGDELEHEEFIANLLPEPRYSQMIALDLRT